MHWTTLNFGKHKGKSLPQVLFSDPDWFFWACNEGVFETRSLLRREAATLLSRATSIRIPKVLPGRNVVEYMLYPNSGKFSGFEIVQKSLPAHDGSTQTLRSDHIDMSFPCRLANYDKLGCAILVRNLKFVYFGSESARMTRARCEAFFDDLSHFNCSA
jgi:hypothetical protein